MLITATTIVLISSMLLVKTDAAMHPTCPNWLSLSFLQTRDFCPPGGPLGCVRDPTTCDATKPVCCTPDWCPTYGICTDTTGFCRDVNGQLISHGQQYAVDANDPCSMCTCMNGRRENCQSLKCADQPVCTGASMSRGRCCEYECPVDIYGDPIKGIRLIGGNSPREGRVEILLNNTWGTVCDDNFNEKAARVVCRMLGYDAPQYTAIVSKFGPGTDSIHFRDITCFGNEQSIWWCMRGVRSCTHFEDVGVSCLVTGQVPTSAMADDNPTPTMTPMPTTRWARSTDSTASSCVRSSTVRLVGGRTDWMGRVEVFHNRQWGSVCDDYWGVNNAEVVCRSLCYDPQYAAVYQDSLIPPGNGTIWLDDVQCNGDEAVLERCQHAPWGSTNCQHEEDVAIACQPLENLMATTISIDEGRWPIVRCRQDSVSACFDLSDVGNDPRYVALTVDQINNTCTSGGRVNAFAFESNDLASHSYVEFTNTSFKCLRISRNGCGTAKTQNQTHFTYNNTIIRTNTAPSSGGTFRFIIKCSAQRYYSPLSASYKTYLPEVVIEKTYLYQVSMCFCTPVDRPQDPCVAQDPVQISRGSLLQACIILTTKEQNLEIVVHNCSVQAGLQVPESQKYYLFKNKCRTEDSVVFSPWTSLMYAFEFQARQYLDIQDTVYVVCQAYVCNADDSSIMCDRTCTSVEKPPQPNPGPNADIGGSATQGGGNRNRLSRRDTYSGSVFSHHQSTAHSPDFVQVYLGPIRVSELSSVMQNFDPEEFVRRNLSRTIKQRTRYEKSDIPESDRATMQQLDPLPHQQFADMPPQQLQQQQQPAAAPLSQLVESIENNIASSGRLLVTSSLVQLFVVLFVVVMSL